MSSAPPQLAYTESDRIVWEEDLDSFVPVRFFDAHAHLWNDAHIGPDNPRRNRLIESGMAVMRHWNQQFFPGRQIEYLILGMPVIGVDVAGHNRFVAAELKDFPNSRKHRLVTPQCRAEDIR
jgi:hypothetical protein